MTEISLGLPFRSRIPALHSVMARDCACGYEMLRLCSLVYILEVSIHDNGNGGVNKGSAFLYLLYLKILKFILRSPT